MPSPTLKEILDTIRELRAEDTKFLEKYSEHIDTLKGALTEVNEQKKSWVNRHRWLFITIAILLVIFLAPIVMKHNNICQFNINFNESVGFQECKK